MIKNLTNTLKTLFLFIGLLYAWIPFESSSSVLIHSVSLIAILVYALYVGNFKIRINKLGIIILLMLTIFTLIGLFVSSERDGLIFSFSIMFGSLTASIIHYNIKFHNQFLIALKWLITFSISMLLLQIIILKITGNVIEIHEVIYPFSHARIGTYANFIDLYRMGGIYIEPGTYANLMYLFLIIYIVLKKNISSPLLFIGAISIIFSYSVWGMIFGSYLLILLLLARFKKSTWRKKFLVFFVISGIGLFFINYAVNSSAFNFAINKVSSNTSSVAAKQKAYNKYSENFDDFLIIGQGFKAKFNEGIPSVQDSGFLLNMSVVFGIFFTVMIFILYSRSFLKCCTGLEFLLSLPIFISKIYYYDPAFWLLFFLVIYGGSKLNLNNSN